MKEILSKLNLLYYSIYSGTIVLLIMGYFLVLNNSFVSSTETSPFYVLTYLHLFLCVPLLGYGILAFEIKKRKKTNTTEEKKKTYLQFAKIRLISIGITVITGLILFYLMRNYNNLYITGIAALLLIYSKPTATKIANELELEEE